MKGVASAGRAGAAPRAPGAEVLLLAVESATSVPGVAVLRGEELLVELAQPGDQHHAETLLPLVDRALAHSGLELDEIEAFVASVRSGDTPLVGAAEGLIALDMAERVLEALESPGEG